MADPTQSPEAATWCAAILYKLLPGGLGAAVMVCVDPPQNKRELFARLLVAFAVSYFLGDIVFDVLRSYSWLSALNPSKRAHTVGVDFIVGGAGWFVVGAAAMFLKRLKADPAKTIEDAKRVAQ